MDPKTVVDTFITYGKSPVVRALCWILVTLLGKYGMDQANAGNISSAIAPALLDAAGAIGLILWSAHEKKTLHEAAPPAVAA